MKKLLLKFNTVVPGNQMTKIEEMVERYGLTIEATSDEANLRVIAVTGSGEKLAAMEQELVRHASITKKLISFLDTPAEKTDSV